MAGVSHTAHARGNLANTPSHNGQVKVGITVATGGCHDFTRLLLSPVDDTVDSNQQEDEDESGGADRGDISVGIPVSDDGFRRPSNLGCVGHGLSQTSNEDVNGPTMSQSSVPWL